MIKTSKAQGIEWVYKKGTKDEITYNVRVKSEGNADRRSSYEVTLIDKKTKNGRKKFFRGSQYITYIMFNPSHADSNKLDATVKRLIQITDNYSKKNPEVGSFKIRNLYERRSPSPRDVDVNNNEPIRWRIDGNNNSNIYVKAWGSLRATEQGVKNRKAKVEAFLNNLNPRAKHAFLGTKAEGTGKNYHPKAFNSVRTPESGRVPPIIIIE